MDIIDWIKEDNNGSWDRPNLVAYALIEAMSEKAGLDIKEVFNPFNPEALEVEFKVNGVTLSFKHVTDLIQNSLNDLEDQCKKKVYKEVCDKLVTDLSYRLLQE